jgi:hypothetical protein
MIIEKMETKACKKCGVEKLICEFNKDKYSSDGLRYRCRECTSKEYTDYYYKNRESEIDRQVNYQKNNNEVVKQRRNQRHIKKYYSNVSYKLKVNVRNRIKLFIKSSKFDIITNNTFNIVGCTPEELRKHIESQFTEGMSWDNHGMYGWHIDHKIPLSSAKTKEEIFELCKYSNLQPLWCEENYEKGKKII